MARKLVSLDKMANGNLKITLTDEGREELLELIEKHGEDSDAIMLNLLEWQLGNGWESVPAEKIGALTDCYLIITDDVEWDENRENILDIGRVYWHPDYMVESVAKSLLDNGVFYLIGTSSNND